MKRPSIVRIGNRRNDLKLIGLFGILGLICFVILRQASTSITNSSPLPKLFLKDDRETRVESERLERKTEPKDEPILEHEMLLRNLDFQIWENYMYLMNEMKIIEKKDDNQLDDRLLHMIATSMDLKDVHSKWRQEKLKELTRKIQSKIHQVQNPIECSKAKYLIYPLNVDCGLGCLIHHVIFSFTVSFGEGRTLILEDDGQWKYSRLGWKKSYQSLTSCAYKDAINNETIHAYVQNSTHRLLKYAKFADLSPIQRPPFLPPALPDQLADQIIRLHSNPSAYFFGQFMLYATRPSLELGDIIQELDKKIHFDKGPVVGIHVRRTDKISEASFHPSHQYIQWAEIWFRIHEIRQKKSIPRRIFLATDEPTISKEIKEKYKNWEVIENSINLTSSTSVNNRYSDLGLLGMAAEMDVLSRCQYLMCTFSSNIGRGVYELMQSRGGDRESAHSLDLAWYVSGENSREQTVIEDYTPKGKGEIELKKGDTVFINWYGGGRLNNGYSQGKNLRTGQSGRYPTYKVEEKWRRVDFPVLNDLFDPK